MINIIDVNEPPVNVLLIPAMRSLKVSNKTLIIPENSTTNSHIGTFHIYDGDNIASIRTQLDNDYNGIFSLNATNNSCQKTSDYGQNHFVRVTCS